MKYVNFGMWAMGFQCGIYLYREKRSYIIAVYIRIEYACNQSGKASSSSSLAAYTKASQKTYILWQSFPLFRKLETVAPTGGKGAKGLYTGGWRRRCFSAAYLRLPNIVQFSFISFLFYFILS